MALEGYVVMIEEMTNLNLSNRRVLPVLRYKRISALRDR